MEGMTLEKLQVIIEAYTKPYRDELEKVKQQTRAATTEIEKQTSQISTRVNGTMSRVNSTVSRAGRAVRSALGVVGVAAIVAFTKSCVDLGSDLQEVQNVVDVTFGSMSAQVDSFSKNAITQFGLSELAAKRYMGTYGAMAKSFGIVGEAGYQMSAAITGLTGDVASFYNLSPDEAYTKLKSIFTGETESLKELGVVMTQTALDQYALNNGFGKTTAKMTEQEKAILRYQFVMSSLADASGDFARTSGSWANQTRILALQFDSLRATIGQGLINAFTPVIRAVNTLLSRLQTLAAYFKAFTVALFGDAGSGSTGDTLGSAAGSSGDIADNMGSAAGSAKKMREYMLGIDELNVLNPDDSSGSGGGSGGAGGSLDFGNIGGELFEDVTVNPEIEEAVEKIRDAIERLKDAAKPTTDALKRLWNEGLSKLGKFGWTALEDFYQDFLKPVGEWVLGEGLPDFLDITNDLLNDIDWNKLNQSLDNLWKALAPFSIHVGEGLLWFYEHVMTPIAKWTINYTLPSFLDRVSESLDGINYYIELVSPGIERLGKWLDNLSKLIDNSKLNQGIDKINGFFERLGIKIELPSLEEFFTDKAVDNALRSVGVFDVILSFSDRMKVLEGLETWWNEHVSPYLDSKRWEESTVVIWDSVGLAIGSTITNWKQKISAWWQEDVAPWFTLERWMGIADNLRSGIMTKWDETVGQWGTDISNWWDTDVAPWFTRAKWEGIAENFRKSIKTKWDAMDIQWGTDIQSWWTNDVSSWFTFEKWAGIADNLRSGIKTKWDAMNVQWGTDIESWWDDDVSPWFTLEKWQAEALRIKDAIIGAFGEMVSQWKLDIQSWWDDDVSPWFSYETWLDVLKDLPGAFRQGFQDAIDAAGRIVSDFLDGIKRKIRDLFSDAEDEADSYDDWSGGDDDDPYHNGPGYARASSISYTVATPQTISQYSSGGQPRTGELFMANEKGPELIGRIGGKTSVVNNEQIVTAVSEGVADAFARALEQSQGNDSGEPIVINLTVDGRTLSTVSTNTKRRGGFNFHPA